ncbi:MMPL family transporter [Anaerotignum sp.]
MPGTYVKKKNKLERVARFIVEKRKAIYLIYILLAIFCVFSSGWVSVNNTLTDYLAEDTETSRGLKVMEEEFITYATAEVMVDTISYRDAEALCETLEGIEGVKEIAFDDTTKHYADGAALFSVTFEGESDDPICETALENIRTEVEDYDSYISAELGNTEAETIAAEMNVVMVLACVIILSVLLFTSRTYMEIPVMILTFGMAAILNKGTSFIFGEISFVSDSIAIVLQLALAIDYAIILCHRYMEERETSEPMDATVAALCKAIPEISGSCMTTLSGLAAMAFMHFEIGRDMSMVLIKAIILSILSVFTLMPGLLYSFSSKIDSTHHRSFVPKITAWTNLVVKLRHITPYIFAVLLVASFLVSKDCAYVYSYTNLKTFTKNESQIAEEKISDTFTDSNVLAVLIPSGDYEKEQALTRDLESLPEVDQVTGLATVEAEEDGDLKLGDQMTPRELAEFADIDIELVELLYTAYAVDQEEYGHIVGGIDRYEVPLIDMFEFIYEQVENGAVSLDAEEQADLDELYADLTDGKDQLNSGKYSRLVMELNVSEESEETFAFLDTARETVAKYYGEDVLLVGNATSNFDLASTFGEDNTLISILSIVFVMIVLFLTFQSAGVPFILILVIQGSIWMNFTYPTLQHTPIFFMSYLVVSSIQMGANIDYAIVITNRYLELRKKMPKVDAIKESLELAFPTIFTSGSILAAAGTVIGFLSSDGAISGIGICLGRGTLISIVLVMGILPQLLLLGDFIIEKTSFKKSDHRKEAEEHA